MRRDRGSATIELTILMSVVYAFFAVVVIAGRITLARQATDAAAFDAARTASLARSPFIARTQARQAALESFTRQGIQCRSLSVEVDTTGFAVPVGQPAVVRVTVTCVAELADIAARGMPGTATLRSAFVSPLDRYRSRALGFEITEGSTGGNSGVVTT